MTQPKAADRRRTRPAEDDFEDADDLPAAVEFEDVDDSDDDMEDEVDQPENGVDPDHPDAMVELVGDWKVAPRWVDASDMPTKVVLADGTQETQTGHHDGESVWFSPTISMGTMFTTAGLALYGSEGGREGNRRMVKYADDLFGQLAGAVAQHTLTGLDGVPYPQTRILDDDGNVVGVNADAFRNASDDEIAWLLAKATGQEPEEVRKNALAASRSTTGAKGRRRRKRR